MNDIKHRHHDAARALALHTPLTQREAEMLLDRTNGDAAAATRLADDACAAGYHPLTLSAVMLSVGGLPHIDSDEASAC